MGREARLALRGFDRAPSYRGRAREYDASRLPRGAVILMIDQILVEGRVTSVSATNGMMGIQ